MKAITLTQPWATLVAIGAKQIETRSWSTRYRRPIAIHAAKGFGSIGGKKGYRELCATEPFYTVLMNHGEEHKRTHHSLKDYWDDPLLPLGMVIAIATLIDVVPTENIISQLSPQEVAFGDYSAGRYAWRLKNIRRLPRPIEYKGALGLWDFEVDLLKGQPANLIEVTP